MRFGEKIVNHRVPEWAEAYIEYNILKKLLDPAKILQKKFVTATYTQDNLVFHISNKRSLRVEEVLDCVRVFEKLVKSEILKIDMFFQYKLLDLMQRFELLMINATFIQRSLGNQNREQVELKLRYSFKVFFKEASMMKEFIELNMEGVQRILKKYSKIVSSFSSEEHHQEFSLVKRVLASKKQTYLTRNEPKLLNILKRTEESYITYFYPDISMQKAGRKDFRKYTLPVNLSQRQVLFYGIFVGISSLLLLFIVIRFIEVYSQSASDNQRRQLSVIFPIFRGNGLFIANFWFIALNVNGWQNNHINYKLIFKFNHHFSQMYQILQRAAFFTVVYFVCFVFYILLNTPGRAPKDQEIDMIKMINWIDIDLFPFFGWMILLIYVFFPFTKYTFFNLEGRIYFFKLLLDCLKSPFVKMEFRISWMTDMLVSFAGPLKDFETTICFYFYKFKGGDPTTCLAESRITSFMFNIIPTVSRLMQCCRQGYDKGVFWRTLPFYNMLKYLFSLFTSYLSYQYTISKTQTDLVLWLVLGSFSTLYSFYWDITQDWGLLHIGKTWKETVLFPRKMCYGSKNFYYFAIVSNLILRVVWALNISLGLTDMIDGAMNVPGMFKFIIYMLEMYRRCQWNFFRVELEHINNCKQYKAVVDLELPLKVDLAPGAPNKEIEQFFAIPPTQAVKTGRGESVIVDRSETELSEIVHSSALNNSAVHGLKTPLAQISSEGRIQGVIKYSKQDTVNKGYLSSKGDFVDSTYNPLGDDMNGMHKQLSGAIDINSIPELDESASEFSYVPTQERQETHKNNHDFRAFDEAIDSKKMERNALLAMNYTKQYRREENKILFALIQFEYQLKKGVSSPEFKESIVALNNIKTFLKSEGLNKVEICKEEVTTAETELTNRGHSVRFSSRLNY